MAHGWHWLPCLGSCSPPQVLLPGGSAHTPARCSAWSQRCGAEILAEDDSLNALSQRAASNRRRLSARLRATRARLTPDQLKADATYFAMDQIANGRDAVIIHARKHPVRTTLSLLLTAAWLARRPLLDHGPAVVRRGYAWLSGKLSFMNAKLNEDVTETGHTAPENAGVGGHRDDDRFDNDNDGSDEGTLP